MLQRRRPLERHALRERPERPKQEKASDRGPRYGMLDADLIKRFCRLIREGLPADGACDYLLISPGAFWNWLRIGKQYSESDPATVPDDKMVCVEFVKQYRRSSAKYRRERIRKLHNIDGPGWIREMTILERRDRRSFSRVDPQGGGTEEFDPDEKFL